MTYFKTWIKQFIDLPKPIGDLARDMDADHINFPNSNDYSVIHQYLFMQKRASPNAMRTFDEAWKEYLLSKEEEPKT